MSISSAFPSDAKAGNCDKHMERNKKKEKDKSARLVIG
jgi:hypothetical protein